MNLECRSLVEPVEFRSAEGGRIIASGVAMRYGAVSKPVTKAGRGVFRETFTPGAFAKTIQEQDIRSHLEHFGPYLGRTSNGTLRLHDSRSELAYELDLPDTTAGRDAAVLLERRDVRGCSVGFKAMSKGETWTAGDDGLALRSVTQARLGVLDLTVAPAYDDSTAEMALRSLAASHHLDVDEVLAAADAGDLRSLLDLAVEDDDGSEHRDDRETPIVRARMSHLFV